MIEISGRYDCFQAVKLYGYYTNFAQFIIENIQ